MKKFALLIAAAFTVSANASDLSTPFSQYAGKYAVKSSGGVFLRNVTKISISPSETGVCIRRWYGDNPTDECLKAYMPAIPGSVCHGGFYEYLVEGDNVAVFIDSCPRNSF